MTERTGLRVSSFSGVYRPEGEILVNQVQDDPRLEADFPRVENDGQIPETTFPAAHVVGGRHPFGGTTSLGEYTLKGPKLDTMRPFKGNVNRFAYDPDARQWYGLGHEVFALDLQGQSATQLSLSMDVPPFSHPRGLALDTKRQRLLVATLGGEGFLYSYSLAERRWSVVASMNNVDVDHLCYLPADDSLYSITLGYDGNSHTIPTLLRLNAEGAVLSRERLEGPFFAGMLGGPYGGSVQLIPLGQQLVLIAQSSSHDSDSGSALDSATYIFLIDPQKAKARLTWKSNDTPARAAPANR